MFRAGMRKREGKNAMSTGAVRAKPEVPFAMVMAGFDYIAALKQLFWDSMDGMVITDHEQRVVAVNPAFVAITGIPAGDWIGSTPSVVRSGQTPIEVYQEMWHQLNTQGKWLGELINRRPDGSEWASFLSITRLTSPSGQLVGYVGLTRDVTEQKKRQQDLVQHLREIETLQQAATLALAEEAEFRDPDISGHLARIEQYTALLIEALREERHPELGDAQAQERIVRCSVLHDIGKVGIPEGILLKPARLRPEEYEVAKLHALIGGQMLERADVRVRDGTGQADSFFGVAAGIARHHHERWDGKGYPDGLSGTAIPLPARIVALADVYDALSSQRVYKPAWPLEEVEQYILGHAGSQFDPMVAAAFNRVRSAFRSVAEGKAESN